MSGNRLPPDTGPPKNERGLGTALKAAKLLLAYQLAPSVQARWLRYAELLLTRYRKTGKAVHWRMYRAQVTGMAAVLERSGQ